MGAYLIERLHSLSDVDMVGDIRGLGLFAGIELVQDKKSRQWFDPSLKVNIQVANQAFNRGLIIYPGSGGIDGIHGDHILLAPPFTITQSQIDDMVDILRRAIHSVEAMSSD